jgi:hypothetical protein
MTYRPYEEIKSTAVEGRAANNTGVTIPKSTPIRVNTSGEIDFVNVANESQILNVYGAAAQSIPNGDSGNIAGSGRIEDITTTFDFGDVVYISKTGGLTNQKPSDGVDGFVAGDFVILMGVIAKNESNPSLKDLILTVERIGQL